MERFAWERRRPAQCHLLFCFLRAGGADGAIARRWSVAKRRATPGNGEEENQALEGRQIIQIIGMLFSRPCRGFPYYCSSILGLRAASQRSGVWPFFG